MNPSTHSSRTGILLATLLQLCVSSLSSAQDAAAPDVVSTPTVVEAIDQAEPEAETLRKFEIEVVVFAYNAFDPAEETFTSAHAASSAHSTPVVFDESSLENDPGSSWEASSQLQLLGPQELTLTAECEKLKRLDAYTVLAHGGWVQEGLPAEDAPEIDISLFAEPNVTGTLRFHVNRYAHVTAAIDYQASADPDPQLRTASNVVPSNVVRWGSTLAPSSFQLRESRRMRSGELHYFDHPAFGLLVTVRPYDEVG